MRFFRKSPEQSEAPCPRCCIAIATEAHECPYCGYDLERPEAAQDGWTAPARQDADRVSSL